ncbi:MAG: PEP-CTERM sorting domain-containing protein [Phycisphaerae bacterium]|nr:PEP-CTERM sorting domain-containing protein [Phycisphaerae bacterium]MDD5381672.1 PEP-CTERM sorting domain-containing protein [Phycisphaerae bacterium]
MKNTHKLSTIMALVVVVILSLITTANAALVTYSDTYGPTTVGSAAGWAGASLSKFNPALGTLTKVTLTLNSDTYAGQIHWDNEGGSPSDVTLGIGAEVTIDVLSSALVVTAVPLQTGSGSVTLDNDGVPDYIGTDAFSVTGGSGNDIESTSSTNGAVLASFTGAGTFDAWLSTNVSTFISTTGGYGPSIYTLGLTGGLITVAYEYNPVPEPVTIALLGLGSMFAIRNKRKR